MQIFEKPDQRGRTVALLGGIGLGALLMYVFDPERGKRRRALARDQAGRLLRKGEETAGKRARDLSNRARGASAKSKSLLRRDGGASDDLLVERVRSQIGHATTHPSSLEVTAREGWVTLSGPVLAEETGDLLASVRSVRGVKGVENLLEVHSAAEDVAVSTEDPEPKDSEPPRL